MTSLAPLESRAIVAVSGPEAAPFLQGLVTNDVLALRDGQAGYAAFLTPQGKVLFDFLILAHNGEFLLDCAAGLADSLVKRLLLHRLRSKVTVERRSDLAVLAGWNGATPIPKSFADPRVAELGWRAILPTTAIPPSGATEERYTAHRLDCGVPEGAEFGQDSVFALDADLDELHGVSFEKGCYVGQELTARMKHRGTARRRILPVATSDGRALAAPDSPLLAGDHDIGTILSTYGPRGFALVRLDRLSGANAEGVSAAGIAVRVSRPSWLSA
ncbi:MAG: folate-binding protein [Rhizomicrobium sp.]|jgi:folate-binding protein YgfZ